MCEVRREETGAPAELSVTLSQPGSTVQLYYTFILILLFCFIVLYNPL